MSDMIQPAIELLSFSSPETAANSRVQHVLNEIGRLLPDRAIIVGGWDKNLAAQLKKSNLSGQYDIQVNDSCSLNWLQQTVAAIRTGNKRAVLMSNFPRQGDARLATDGSTRMVLFFWGPYAGSYCADVIRSLAQGGEIISCQLLVDPSGDSDLLDKERKQLKACHDKAQCQVVIQGILNSLEGDPNCPVANWGGVLV